MTENIKCCGQLMKMSPDSDGLFCNYCGDFIKIKKSKTKTEVTWHKYPDEMPDLDSDVIFYVKDRDSYFCGKFRMGRKGEPQFEENLDYWWFDEEIITIWAYLQGPKV